MSCPNYKRLCKRLIISEAVTFAGDTLTINIPEGTYGDCEKYCIVVAQTIPTTTTVAANVVITIGDDTTAYPLLNCDLSDLGEHIQHLIRVQPIILQGDLLQLKY